MKDFGKKVNLNKVLEELQKDEYIQRETAYARFKKIIEALGTEANEWKDEKGEIWFYEDETELIKGLIVEMENPYLMRTIGSKKTGETIKEKYEAGLVFRENMLKRIEKIKHQELQDAALNIVDFFSRKTERELLIENQEKVKEISELIYNTKMYAEERTAIIMEINEAMDKYLENLKKRFENKEKITK